jgi:hypothetical protein
MVLVAGPLGLACLQGVAANYCAIAFSLLCAAALRSYAQTALCANFISSLFVMSLGTYPELCRAVLSRTRT